MIVPPANYWEVCSRNVLSTPLGRRVAVSFHNCYSDEDAPLPANLQKTLDYIHYATGAGADLIELDVHYHDDVGAFFVYHTEPHAAHGVLLASVLESEDLHAGTVMLFVEVKSLGGAPAAAAAALIEELTPFAANDRPVFLRGQELSDLEKVKAAISSLGADNFRLHYLIGAGRGSAIAAIDAAASLECSCVEFSVHRANLAANLAYCRSKGLATGLWDMSEEGKPHEMVVAAVRESIDQLTVYDKEKALTIGQARTILAEQNTLLYGDMSRQDQNDSFEYVDVDQGAFASDFGGNGSPAPVLFGAGDMLFGGAMHFNSLAKQCVPLLPCRCEPGGGFLVSVVCCFDDLEVGLGDTKCIVAKADQSGFSLELFGGPDGAVLRFGVRVGGSYRYAGWQYALPGDNADGKDPYLCVGESFVIVGAYDGSGRVRLSVNGHHVGESGNIEGGVLDNNVAVQLGADPQPGEPSRFYLSGTIQAVQVLAWNNEH